MLRKPLSPFQQHCADWKDGCGSQYCEHAMRKTYFRGDIPCDILFVGEAPGKSENSAGIPFCPGAPAGKLLAHMVRQSIPQGKRVGYTNIVICIPRAEGEEKIEPDADQISSCKPRLEEIISLASPRLIVAVGSQARDALTQGYLHSTRIPKGCSVLHIVHPAFILRQTTAFQGMEIQDTICKIRDAVIELDTPKKPAPEYKGIDFGKHLRNTPKPNSDIMSFGDDDPIPF